MRKSRKNGQKEKEMITEISTKIATLIQEDEELRDLIKLLVKEANFVGQKGNSISNIQLTVKKKNLLLFRFFPEYYIEWEEGT